MILTFVGVRGRSAATRVSFEKDIEDANGASCCERRAAV